jgi:hypothetical protein
MLTKRRETMMAAAVLLAGAGVLGCLALRPAPTSYSVSGASMIVYDGGGSNLKVQGAEGGWFTTEVLVNDAVDVGAFTFEMHFDDSIISFDEVTEETFLSQGGSTACSPTSAPGFMQYACTLTGGGGVTGSGLIAVRFLFDQDYDGMITIDMQDCGLADSDGDPIAVKGCNETTLLVSPEPPEAPVVMDPPSVKAQAPVGSTFTFDVMAGEVTDFGGFEFAVEFDDSVLNVSNIREGPFLGSAGGDTICFFNSIGGNPTSSRASFACVVFGKEGPTGSGVIAHVDVTMKAPFVGTTPLSLVDCGLADEQGFNIPVSACTGATLQTNATPTATPSHTPTTTPITPQDIGGMSRDPALDGGASGARGTAGGSTPMTAVLVTLAALAAAAGAAAYAVHRRTGR